MIVPSPAEEYAYCFLVCVSKNFTWDPLFETITELSTKNSSSVLALSTQLKGTNIEKNGTNFLFMIFPSLVHNRWNIDAFGCDRMKTLTLTSGLQTEPLLFEPLTMNGLKNDTEGSGCYWIERKLIQSKQLNATWKTSLDNQNISQLKLVIELWSNISAPSNFISLADLTLLDKVFRKR